MTEQQKKACEKIAKLFALANDPRASEGERSTAMKLAADMMSKYNVSDGDLNKVDMINDWSYVQDEDGNTYTNLPKWLHMLYSGIYKNFGIFMLLSQDEDGDSIIRFSGREVDITIADYCFDTIFTQILNLQEKYRKENKVRRGSAELSSYMMGLALGVIANLKSILSEVRVDDSAVPNSTSKALTLIDQNLVKYEDAQGYFIEQNPDSRFRNSSISIKDGAAAWAGRGDSSSVKVRAGVTGNGSQTLSLGRK